MIFPANNPQLADTILSTLSQVCQQHDIPYFLTAGTCLGLYRDGCYLPADPDLDVSLPYHPDLRILLYHQGLVPDNHGKFEHRHYWKENMLLDITWIELTGFYEFYDEVEYNGSLYPVPHPVEDYLVWKYGPTWETPLEKGQYIHQHG